MNWKKILKKAAGILFIIALTVNAFPRWYVNGSDRGFEDPGKSSAAISLEAYVVQGAGYFLDSYAHTLLFMKKLEWSGKNGAVDPESALLLDNALKSMELAHDAFSELKRLADTTPYNTAVIDALCKFDYDDFRAAYGIEDKTFDRVRYYLSNGDIRSVYGDIVTDTGTIVKLLKEIKEQVDTGAFPSTWDVWKLDRTYSAAERFGQYTARVFDAIGTMN
jgi:hypothetical protein